MFRLLAAVLFFTTGIAAQLYIPIGFPSDPCSSSSAIWSAPTLRYGPSFVCSVTVDHPGSYLVTLTFQEPNVTAVGGRVFSVSANGFPGIQNLDLVAAGATSPGIVITRSFPAFSVDGTIRLQLAASVRNAVLSSITVTPPPSLTGQPCKVPDSRSTTLAIQLADGTCLPLLVVTPSGLAQVMVEPQGLTIYPSGAIVPAADAPQWGRLADQASWRNFGLWLLPWDYAWEGKKQNDPARWPR